MTNFPCTWPRLDHTKAKHLLLETYIVPWWKRVANFYSGTGQVIHVIDAYGGPGRYQSKDSTDPDPTAPCGSPLIILDAVATPVGDTRVVVHVYEQDRNVFGFLEKSIHQFYPSGLPSHVELELHCTDWRDVRRELIQDIDDNPALLIIDPFGVPTTDRAFFERFMSGKSRELIYMWMWKDFWRRRSLTERKQAMVQLFGANTDWVPALTEPDSERARSIVFKAFRSMLARLNAEIVSAGYFEIHKVHTSVPGSDCEIGVFFCSKSKHGIKVFKNAIWTVVPDGSYQYRADMHDPNRPQLELMDTTSKSFGDHRRDEFLVARCAGEQLSFAQIDKKLLFSIFHHERLRTSINRLTKLGIVTRDSPPGKIVSSTTFTFQHGKDEHEQHD